MIKKIYFLFTLTVFSLFIALPEIGAQPLEKQLFRDGENRFSSGEYEIALNRYDEFLDHYPLSNLVPDVQFRRAICLYRLGRYEESFSLLGRIEVRYRTTGFLPFLSFWKGMTAFQQGRYSPAAGYFTEYLGGADSSLSVAARYYQGMAYYRDGDFSSAQEALEMLSSEELSARPYATALLSSFYLREERYETLLSLTEGYAAIERVGTTGAEGRILLYRAEALRAIGEMNRAMKIYENLKNGEPEVAAAAFIRLFEYYEEDWDARRALIDEGEVVLSGAQVTLLDFWLRIAIASYRQGKEDLAEVYLNRIRRIAEPQQINGLVPLYLAEIGRKQGDLERAIAVLEEYTSPDTDREEYILFNLTSLYIATEKWARAIEILTDFMTRYPESKLFPRATYLLAYSVYRQDDYSRSLKIIESLINSTEFNIVASDALMLGSVLYQKVQNLPASLRLMEEYHTLHPDDSTVTLEILKLQFHLGRFSVVASFGGFSGDGSREENYTALYLKGLSLLELKQYQGAITLLKDIPPDLPSIGESVLFYRGWAEYRLAEYENARESFEEYLEKGQDREMKERALYLAGWCAYNRGDFQTAEKHFNTYSHTGGDPDRGVFMYGKSLFEQDRLKEAGIVFRSLGIDNPSSPFGDDAYFEYARILNLTGDGKGSAEAYLQLAKGYPRSNLAEESYYRRAEVLFSAELWEQARLAYYDYRTRYPGGTRVGAALFWGGRAFQESAENFGAVLLWEKLAEDFPDSQFRFNALLETARIYAVAGDIRKAYNYYHELSTLYPQESAGARIGGEAEKLRYQLMGQSDREAELSVTIGKEGGAATEKGREAILELSRIFIYQGGGKQGLALKMLGDVLTSEQATDHETAQVHYLIGEYYSLNQDPVEAAGEFLKAAVADPADRDLMARSMFRAAEMTMLGGNISQTRALVRRLKENFPDSQWAAEAESLLEGGRE